MSVDQQPLTTEEALPPQISHRRILIVMTILILVGTIAGTIFSADRFGLGILVGGVLAFANYFWQKNSLEASFSRTAAGGKSEFPAFKFLLRYIALGLVVAFFYVTGALPIVAVVLGLAAFTFSVVIEGILGIFSGTSKQGS